MTSWKRWQNGKNCICEKMWTYTEVEVYVLFVCQKLEKNFLVNERNYLSKMRTRAKKKNVASDCVRRRMCRGIFIVIGRSIIEGRDWNERITGTPRGVA